MPLSSGSSRVTTECLFPTCGRERPTTSIPTVKEPELAVASVKQMRDKSKAKKAVRAQGFTFLQDLEQQNTVMSKPVTTVTYDMRSFLQQCLDRYVELAPRPVTFKKVTTPFHDDKIARPTAEENELAGRLKPIASKILMKVLFAARMARFDLLRATQGLASRVTKWSHDCDVALHRLMCYVHSTLDLAMVGFVGDEPIDCKLWLFADSDHAGEHDGRSTTGCVLALVGPNTYFPLTAFSKKQTSTAMSSTEAEVVAANLATRSVGLPSSCLWQVIRNAGGTHSAKKEKKSPRAAEASIGNGCTDEAEPREWNTKDYWEFDSLKNEVVRHHVTPREHLFYPVGTTCPVELKRLAAQRYTVAKFTDGTVDFDLTWSWQEDRSRALKGPWTGKTVFRFPGTNEVDYGIEAREVRHASTDTSYIGCESPTSMSLDQGHSRSCFLKTIRQPFASWSLESRHRLGTQTRHRGLALHGCLSSSNGSTST